MNFLSFIIKDLFRRRIRCLLTILGITVGITTCIIMLALSQGIQDSFRNAYTQRNIDVVVFAKDEFNLLASRIDASLAAKLNDFPQVESATGIILDIVKYKRAYIPLYGWPPDSPLFTDIKINGVKPRPGYKEVLIGELFARNSGKKIDDTVIIKRNQFRIVGIFKSDIPFEKSAFIIPLDTLQRLKRIYMNTVMAINISLRPAYKIKEKMDPLLSEIETAFPEVSAQSSDIFGQERTNMILMGEKFAQLVFLITLLAVIFGLSNTMTTSVFEKRKLMGFLLTTGWEKIDIVKSMFFQSLILSLLGGLFGVIIGFFATGYIFNMLIIQVFSPSWNYLFILKVIGMILSVSVISTLISSWVIVNINPIEVIRNG